MVLHGGCHLKRDRLTKNIDRTGGAEIGRFSTEQRMPRVDSNSNFWDGDSNTKFWAFKGQSFVK